MDAPARTSFTRTVWAVGLPVMFAEVSETLIHVIDTMFLARVGTVELAALALADTILELSAVAIVGLVVALQIVVARRNAQGRERDLGRTFTQGILILVAVSLASTVAVEIVSPHLAGGLIAAPAVGMKVHHFLRISALGLMFTAVSFAFGALYIGIGKTRVLIGATAVLAVTNVVLDYVLIFGHAGSPRLGMEGAAWASVGAEVATVVFFVVHTVRSREASRYALFRLESWSAGAVESLIHLASPAALQALVQALQWLAFFLLIARLGTGPLAWSNVIYACFALFMIPTWGFSETVSSLVGNLVGRGQESRIRALVRGGISPTYLVTLPVVAVAVAAPHALVAPFTHDPTLVSGSYAGVRVVALAMLVIIPAEMWLAAVLGTGDTQAAFMIEVLFTAVLLACAFAAVSVFHLTLTYVWMSLPLAWMLRWAMSYGWLRRGTWKRQEI